MGCGEITISQKFLHLGLCGSMPLAPIPGPPKHFVVIVYLLGINPRTRVPPCETHPQIPQSFKEQMLRNASLRLEKGVHREGPRLQGTP